MLARSSLITFVLLGCAEPKPERVRLASSESADAVPKGEPSVSSMPSASVSPPTTATASAVPAPDVSYPDDPPPSPSASASSTPVTDVSFEEVLQDYARQAGSLRSRPQGDGVELRGLRADRALARLGLKNGDVLKDINGFDMSDPDKAVDAYAKLRRAKRLELRVLRDGKPMTFVVAPK